VPIQAERDYAFLFRSHTLKRSFAPIAPLSLIHKANGVAYFKGTESRAIKLDQNLRSLIIMHDSVSDETTHFSSTQRNRFSINSLLEKALKPPYIRTEREEKKVNEGNV